MANLADNLNLAYLFLSAILFFVGIYLGPVAVDRQWTALLRYPRWLFALVERWIRGRHQFLWLFPAIFLLNNISLCSSFLAGLLVFPAPLLAFFTGFNVSVVTYDIMRWRGIWMMLTNPVAWLEFPAAWISFALGFQLAEHQLRNGFNPFLPAELPTLMLLYLSYVALLLLLAAALEAGMISFMQHRADQDDDAG